jgi:hypothetical protein
MIFRFDLCMGSTPSGYSCDIRATRCRLLMQGELRFETRGYGPSAQPPSHDADACGLGMIPGCFWMKAGAAGE